MKKALLALTLLGTYAAQAQISTGGLPLSMTSGETAISNQYYTPLYYKSPDLTKIMQEDAQASLSDPKPYRAGVLVNTDISFPQSGSMVTLSDGKKVWRAQINMGDVPALLFYYDQFTLPRGVKYYITNANKKQILGAYTADNNSEDGLFATQEVQGGVVNLELDIDRNVKESDIKFHINKAAVMYRSVDHLQQFAGNEDNGVVMKPTGDPIAGYSSVCEINAKCPQGVSYPDQRKATMRIIIPVGGGYVGFCTGTLINNTNGDCTPYVLTATHCESTNSKLSSTFSQWMFFFNFEAPDCAGVGTAPNGHVMTGADFVARSDYDDNNPSITGDFMLLKLKNKVQDYYHVYFAGWNRGTNMPSNSTYINFHHPAGDMKKLAVGTNVSPNGTFNQNSVPATHWAIEFDQGGNEGGSSGSALFDVNGRIIGDLSGGPDIQACPADTNSKGDHANMGKYAYYSKISRNWEYPEGNGATNAQLKPWLDPNNTGVMTTNSLEATTTCSAPATGITNRNAALDNAISVYPNPVVNGTLRVRVNLDKSTDLNIAIYDITGARKATYQLKDVRTGEYAFDMNGYANGAYLISVSNGEATTAKKVMLNR